MGISHQLNTWSRATWLPLLAQGNAMQTAAKLSNL